MCGDLLTYLQAQFNYQSIEDKSTRNIYLIACVVNLNLISVLAYR